MKEKELGVAPPFPLLPGNPLLKWVAAVGRSTGYERTRWSSWSILCLREQFWLGRKVWPPFQPPLHQHPRLLLDGPHTLALSLAELSPPCGTPRNSGHCRPCRQTQQKGTRMLVLYSLCHLCSQACSLVPSDFTCKCKDKLLKILRQRQQALIQHRPF